MDNEGRMKEIKGTSVLILGYGREGKSVHTWLQKHYPTLRIGIADKLVHKELMSGEVFKGATVYNGEGYLFHLSEYDTVIRSPGISPYLPEITEFVKGGGHMTSATNLFFSQARGTTIGVTGTKGKSTTSTLIAHLLSSTCPDVRLAGNIGSPMLDALDGETDKTIFVLELSSHQLFDCHYSPHIAVMLGIVSEHLDYYPDLASYARAKANIVAYQRTKDFVVFNPIHTLVRDLVKGSVSAHITYGIEADMTAAATLDNGNIFLQKNGKREAVIAVSRVPLLGNQENVLAAVTVAHLMGVPAKTMATAITPFRSLPHRLEKVGVYKGIQFYNDSLATIPQATIHALEALGDGVVTLLVGGYDRHLDYSELGAYLRSHPVPTLILFPDTGKRVWDAIGDVTRQAESEHIMRAYPVQSMEEAVRIAFDNTPPGKICLLSPGAASYNMFKNYEDRGNQFKNFVMKFGLP